MDWRDKHEILRKAVDSALDRYLPKAAGPASRLMEAMRYSALAPGKRTRPILALRACELCGGEADSAMPVACAIECIHAYSLIHDDLPALDNDDLRRGKPTNHKKFDEATAILAGDALLTFAFDLASASGLKPDRTTRIISIITTGAGWSGMVGGQMADILYEKSEPSEKLLDFIHTNKTGALIRASVLVGAAAAGADEVRTKALDSFGIGVGFAFQITDDILDATSTTEQLGKGAGKDKDKGKQNAVTVLGLERAQEVAVAYSKKASDALSVFGSNADDLRALALALPLRKR
jgi:geranylgeranyl diphosphate synthase, type II